MWLAMPQKVGDDANGEGSHQVLRSHGVYEPVHLVPPRLAADSDKEKVESCSEMCLKEEQRACFVGLAIR